MASSSSTVDRRADTATATHPKTSRPALRRNLPSNTMTASTSTSSTYTHTSSAASHPYLGDRQLDAIESWKTTVPGKSNCPMKLPEEDPVIQAYLQTKMALFQSLVGASSEKGSGHVGDADDRSTVARCRGNLSCYAE